jgi:hypothetical protein
MAADWTQQSLNTADRGRNGWIYPLVSTQSHTQFPKFPPNIGNAFPTPAHKTRY